MFEPIKILEGDLEVTLKTVTIREVYEALENDGFVHLRGSWFETAEIVDGEIKPIGGCILGQTALNLGVCATENNFNYVPSGVFIDRFYRNTLYSQLIDIPVDRANKWYIQDDADNLGNCIIYWNDKATEKWDSENGSVTVTYDLPTYADVAAMAREVMEPHFDETITLVAASRNPNDQFTVVPKSQLREAVTA